MNHISTFLRIFPFHHCNYTCSYCTVYNTLNTPLKWQNFELLDGKTWATVLKRIGHLYKYVIVSGGEPTLHPDFVQIFNDYTWDNTVVYSNCSRKAIDKFLKLESRIMIYASFHIKEERKLSDKPFLAWQGRLMELQELGHKIQTPHVPDDGDEEIKDLPKWLLPTRMEGDVETSDGGFFSPHIDSSRIFAKELKTVMCATDQFVVAQDGTMWNCQAKMWSKRGEPMGHIRDFDPEGKLRRKTKFNIEKEILCHEFGACHTCSQGKIARKLTEEEMIDG